MTDLDDAADELYALAPEEFVAARTRLVKQARAAKDRALANDVNALRKPTRTAWLVNALARDDPDAVGRLLALGDRLRDAQGAKDGAALRELSAQRRTAIDALVRRAAVLGEEAGHPPTETTTNEVAQTLQAALGDPAVAEQVRAGRLAGAAVYGGFGGPADAGDTGGAASGDDGGGDLAALLAASMPAAKKAVTAEKLEEPSPEEEAAERERQEATRRRAALEQARDETRQALDDAQDAADRATEEADRAAGELDRLREELARAEDAEREARAAARAARDEVRTRRTAADEAEQALRDADG